MSEGRDCFLPLFLSALFLASLVSISVQAGDIDGDGIEDSSDDCPYAPGDSSVDRNGCPDRDGDGTSDRDDGWTSGNPNFSIDTSVPQNYDFHDVDFSPDGEFVVSSDENGYVRIWNSTTGTGVQSVQAYSGEAGKVSWSGDGSIIGVTGDDDTFKLFWAENLTDIHGSISADVGSGDFTYDIDLSPNGSMAAIAIGRSGNGGTNGVVRIINTSDASTIRDVNPGSEDRFNSVDFSPSGTHIAVGTSGDFYVVEVQSGTTVRSESAPSGTVNSIAWSPDGGFIAICEGYVQSQGGSRLRMYRTTTWSNIWTKSASTSCYASDFSPDSNQVVFGMGWYNADGATAKIFESGGGGLLVDSFSQPRPNGCSGSSGNNCGEIRGLSWSPDGTKIAQAYARNDEGFYIWFADLDPDNDGWNTTDQGDGKTDVFPDDGTQWNDTDSDGYGDNQGDAFQSDSCVTDYGTSTEDVFGCPDRDGDGWSDNGDLFPDDVKQWKDDDQDGYGDNHYYDVQQFSELHVNQSGDAFPMNPTQWNDTDGDGWGDNYNDSSWDSWRPSEWPGLYEATATQVDVFPLDRYQWRDSDGDGIGDEPFTPRSDGCPSLEGNSTFDRLGCPDSDGDGWSNPDSEEAAHPDGDADAFPYDPTQWRDSDKDGYGDNVSGNNPDDCPAEFGTSIEDRVGCPDKDGDGWSNGGDPFPNDSTQWADRDGDNRGDNPNGSNADMFPDDSSQWEDSDGDGYGDNPVGLNGDWFMNDPTQWHDTDGDGFGDNYANESWSENRNTSWPGIYVKDALNPDVCPMDKGDSNNPTTRGCPDEDRDGYVDPIDGPGGIFKADPSQWEDSDGDGYGDNPDGTEGDSCVEIYGTSFRGGIFGCPDADGDGWDDESDAFDDDITQWLDLDGDKIGDNYTWEMKTIQDPQNPEKMISIREQNGDAFPDDKTQWSDLDGDGYGDNVEGLLPDAFPYRTSQRLDTDSDGYGDNFTVGAYQADDCLTVAGTSIGTEGKWVDHDDDGALDEFITGDRWGCIDSDGDGVSNNADPCDWDPDVRIGLEGEVECAISSDPNKTNNGKSDGASSTSDESSNSTLYILGGIIAFLLAAILIAMTVKQGSRRKTMKEVRIEKMTNAAFDEEEQRREEWVDYYLSTGDLEKARELGWSDAEMPQWKQHEIQQQAETQAAIPTMMSLDDI